MRTHENEPFVVNREVPAVIVPAGVEVKLKPGQAGYITQALGGSFTVYIEGNLFRISGENADASGNVDCIPGRAWSCLSCTENDDRVKRPDLSENTL